jgi:hypothetical protein
MARRSIFGLLVNTCDVLHVSEDGALMWVKVEVVSFGSAGQCARIGCALIVQQGSGVLGYNVGGDNSSE